MSHHIYQTNGFVLGSAAFGEADRMTHFFTEELGLVSAIAKSVRSVKSKLRYSLQDGSYSRIDLVRGLEVWRVTDAEEISRISLVKSPEKARVLAGIFAFIRRFVHGEGREEKIFNTLNKVFFYLQNESYDEYELKNIELFAVMRILHALGYIETQEYVSEKMTKDVLADFSKNRTKILRRVNDAILHSHL